MILDFPPSFIYFIGALLIPLLRGRLRQGFALLVPILGFLTFFQLNGNDVGTVLWSHQFLDFELHLGRVDGWSLIFYNIFSLLSIIGILYILKENSALEFSAGLLYAGAALGVVLAGDLISMFVFWEILTLGAVLLITARKAKRSNAAAFRYLLVHVLGGALLMAGIALHIYETGSIAFQELGLGSVGSYLIFIGFGINCAWPLLGAWLTDTYPEASVGGVIFMATYTTKTAVYVLARTFPGEESLIWIGAAMAMIPIFYAVIENDLRRVLAYSLINQVGFMVVGIGLGTSLSLNGTAAHAYCHILYKALLFMSIGAVLYRTGKSKATELGGLYKSMPFTCICCCIGSASIAFPFFGGFVSKSMVMSAAAGGGYTIVWLALLFASAGVFHQAGIKIPFFAFFSHDSGLRCKDAPLNMQIAMGITAFLCIFVGIFPNAFLYKMIPEAATYEPYTVAHVTDQFALLLFSALAFTLLMRAGLYPAEIRSTNVDTDWFYRKGGRLFYSIADSSLNGINSAVHRSFIGGFVSSIGKLASDGPAKILILAMTPYWTVKGINSTQQLQLRDEIRASVKKGAFPIGITVWLSVLVLAILFLF